MTTPTVTETFIPLERVPRTQRELVILSLLRCPMLAAERRRS